MTYEEALNMLNDMEFADKYQGKDEYTTMLLLCKHALEKQIPKKPNEQKLTVYSGGTRVVNGYCPECGQYLKIFEKTKLNGCELRRDEDKFCSYCGQALDWSDEK